MKLRMRARVALHGYVFILPWIIGFAAFMAWPLLESLRLSFFKLESLVGFRFSFNGISNYVEAFLGDVEFVPILAETILNSLIDVPIILVFSLFVAILVSRDLPGKGAFRAIFFLPVIIGSGMVIRYLMEGSGAVMPIVSRLGFGEIGAAYLGPELAGQVMQMLNRISLILWRSGIQILIFMAGLQGISSSLYEAARADGATAWESFWKITLPMISPIMLLNVIYSIVDSYTDFFNKVLFYIYRKAFGSDLFTHGSTGPSRFGYAAALGWIYFLIIFGLILAVFAWFRKRIYYAGEK